MAEAVRRVYEIDVKLASEAAATLRAMQQSLKATEEQSKRTREATKGAFAVLGAGGGLGGAITALGGVISGLRNIRDTLTAPIEGFFQLGQSVLQVQARLERLRLGFASISGTTGSASLRAAARDIEFVRKTTLGLGTDFQSSAQAFLKLSASARGTALEGQQAREIFEALSISSRNLGLSIPQTENAFRALEQVISKGVVQQEELRGQLSEALPGAVQIAARAFGLTTAELNKFISTGQLTADVFIPKFAAQLKKEFGGEIPDSVNAATKALNNFSSQTELLGQAITDSGIGVFVAGQFNLLSDAIGGITRRITEAKEAGGGFFSQLAAGARGVAAFLNPINAIDYQPDNQLNSLEKVQAKIKEINDRLQQGNTIGRTAAELRRQLVSLTQREAELITQAENTRAGVGETRRIDNLRLERVERDRLSRVLSEFQTTYKDYDAIRKRELADLDLIRDKLGLTAEEYNRLREAIIKKNTKQTDGEKAAEKELTNAQRITENIREQIAVQNQLYFTEDEVAKVLKLKAQIQEDLAKATSKQAKAELELALGLAESLRLATLAAQSRKETQDAREKEAASIEKRIDKLEEEARRDSEAAKVVGKRKDQILAATIAEIEFDKATAQRALNQLLASKGDQEEIDRLRRLIKALNDAKEAKLDLDSTEKEAAFQEKLKDIDEKERQRLAKEQEDIKQSIINKFRTSRDIGKALTDTIQESFERKIFEILVEPQLDILSQTLQRALDEFANYLSGLLSEYLRSLAQANTGGGGGGLLSTIGNVISSFFTGGSSLQNIPVLPGEFGGMFADGGTLAAGKWGIAGEAGPEIIFGGSTGASVVPMDRIGSNVTVNIINAPPGTTYRETNTPDGKLIEVIIARAKDAVAADITAGGKVSSSMQQAYPGLKRATPRTGY